MRRSISILLALGALGLVAAPLAAAAPSGQDALADCNSHGTLTRHYSTVDLKAALAAMPAQTKEYTDCYDVIQRALLADLGRLHAGGSGGSGGSLLPTWLIVVVAVLVVSAAALGGVALRRRR